MTSDPKLQVSSTLCYHSKPKTSISYRRQLNQSQLHLTASIHLQQNPQLLLYQAYANNPRQYKLLLYIFNTNINTFYGKANKNLLGQLQDYYKVPLTKQQKYCAESNIENILQRNLNKLCRDVMIRNGSILKGMNKYTEDYKKYVSENNINAMKENGMQNSVVIGQSDQNVQSMTIQLSVHGESLKIGQNFTSYLFNNNPNTKQLIKHRPHSSSRGTDEKPQQIPTNLYNSGVIFKNRHMMLHSTHRNPYHTNLNRYNNEIDYSKIYDENTYNEEQCEVYIRQGSHKRYRNKYRNIHQRNISSIIVGNKIDNNISMNINFNKNTIQSSNMYMDKNKIEDNETWDEVEERQYEKKGNIKQYVTNRQTQREKNKRINLFATFHYNNHNGMQNNYDQSYAKERNIKTSLHKFFKTHTHTNSNFGDTNHHTKSIDNQSLSKIQSRILSIGSTLSTNVSKPQGYKAKSKCWGTTIVSTGKLNVKRNNKDAAMRNPDGKGKNIFSMLRYKA